MLDFETTVRTRQSIRQFLPTPMTESQIQTILADAQHAPSATNIQPWQVYVVSGETLNRLKNRILEKFEQGEFKADFVYEQTKFGDKYENRWRSLYKTIFDSYGVSRDDTAGRAMITRRNAELYDAPHAVFFVYA